MEMNARHRRLQSLGRRSKAVALLSLSKMTSASFMPRSKTSIPPRHASLTVRRRLSNSSQRTKDKMAETEKPPCKSKNKNNSMSKNRKCKMLAFRELPRLMKTKPLLKTALEKSHPSSSKRSNFRKRRARSLKKDTTPQAASHERGPSSRTRRAAAVDYRTMACGGGQRQRRRPRSRSQESSDDASTIPCELSDQEGFEDGAEAGPRSMRNGRLTREQLLRWRFCYSAERVGGGRKRKKKRRRRAVEAEEVAKGGAEELERTEQVEEEMRPTAQPWIADPRDLLRVTLTEILGAAALLDFSVELLQVRIGSMGPAELRALMWGLPGSPFTILSTSARPEEGGGLLFDVVVGLKEKEEDAAIEGHWRPRASALRPEVTGILSSASSEIDRVLVALDPDALAESLNIGNILSASPSDLSQELHQPLVEMDDVSLDAFVPVIRPLLDEADAEPLPEAETKESTETFLSCLVANWIPEYSVPSKLEAKPDCYSYD